MWGKFEFLYGPSADEIALVGGDESAVGAVIGNGYSVMSDWFFQMVFVATAASIVSGAIAERVKLLPFFIFTLALTAFIYPIVGAWTWGGGWLAQAGFSDFAGSTIVHSTGGWGSLGGDIAGGSEAREVPKGWPSETDPAVQRAPGHPGGVHPVAGLVWFQWRLTARARKCAGCSGNECGAGEHETWRPLRVWLRHWRYPGRSWDG